MEPRRDRLNPEEETPMSEKWWIGNADSDPLGSDSEHSAENGLPEHPHVVAVREYLDNAGITPETLRYAATHEALCRSWIFDLLTGLADVMEAETRPIPPGKDDA